MSYFLLTGGEKKSALRNKKKTGSSMPPSSTIRDESGDVIVGHAALLLLGKDSVEMICGQFVCSERDSCAIDIFNITWALK